MEMFGNNVKEVPLTDFVWFQEGPGVRTAQFVDNGVKLLNVTNLIDGEIDLSNTDKYISHEEAFGKYKHFLVDEGDLIIASSGIQASYFDKKMGFVEKKHLPLCMNTSTIRFKILNKTILSPVYFMYFLKSDWFKKQLFQKLVGSAQLNFGPTHLKKMTLFLPESFQLQEQFAEFVRQSDKSKFELEQALSELTATYKRIISENLG